MDLELTGQAELLIVAVSGGIDSIVLLNQLADQYPKDQLFVAHFDHQLRDGSDLDAAFVVKTAKALDLRYRIGVGDVRRYAAERKVSIEMASREMRYRFLADLQEELGLGVIVTAHHADDQVETILLNLLRGTGVKGLSGMEEHAFVPIVAKEIPLWRPFLSVWRDEIEEYAKGKQLVFREDPTNETLVYRRNWVRHQLIPFLEVEDRAIKSRLQQLGLLMNGEEALLSEGAKEHYEALLLDQASNWICFDRDKWGQLLSGWQRRILRIGVEKLSGEVALSFSAIERGRVAIEHLLDGQIELESGFLLELRPKKIWLRRGMWDINGRWPQVIDGLEKRVLLDEAIQLGAGWQIRCKIVSMAEIDLNERNQWSVYLTPNLINALSIRRVREGERIQGKGIRHKVSTLFGETAVPFFARNQWPALVVDDVLVWIPGVRLATHVYVPTDSPMGIHCICYKESD